MALADHRGLEIESIFPAAAERIPLLRDPLSESVFGELYYWKYDYRHTRAGYLQIAALCVSLFVLGWGDASSGPLLPDILRTYHIDYDTVSWTYAFTCAVIFLGVMFTIPLNDRFGFGKVTYLGSALQAICFFIQALPACFPVFAGSSFIGGIGIAIESAQANGYVAILRRGGELKMGLLQSAYGFGSLLAPLCSMQFANHTKTPIAKPPAHFRQGEESWKDRLWHLHFLISFALAAINCTVLKAVFGDATQEECLRQCGEITDSDGASLVTGASGINNGGGTSTSTSTDVNVHFSVNIESIAAATTSITTTTAAITATTTAIASNATAIATSVATDFANTLRSRVNALITKYTRLLCTPSVHFLALFNVVYVGIETTIGGWIVVYLMEAHIGSGTGAEMEQGGAGAAYVASSFFSGLTLGRVALVPVTQKVSLSIGNLILDRRKPRGALLLVTLYHVGVSF
ncbi:hypothetical protein JR316_0002686 [Psilocybe cubensis]|uniref:MFS general substrate transporter n=2 Tax=Psilocybe cubensis TaxID=181762 RepID=A0A8H7Y3Z7_PSICU|nr:hypothetical protein JR316_0002686 [Psilocybe cubensis]KAH9485771.1 hypothetical protein JR316_0002686 [Psilocybe cubensis]